jgi:hypothetical protein
VTGLNAPVRRPPVRALVMVALLRAGAAFGGAGPPLVTDDPGTAEKGTWEINLASTYEERHGESVAELPLVDLNYGLTERVQLKYEVPWVFSNEDGEGHADGLGNSNFGIKWRFFDDADAGREMSVFPQVEFNNPGSSSDERGLVDSGTTWILPVQFEQNLRGIDLDLELGREFRDDEDGWIYGVAVSGSVSPRLELAAELFGTASSSLDRSTLLANLGLRVGISERIRLLVAVGRELHDNFEEPVRFQAYCALQLLVD